MIVSTILMSFLKFDFIAAQNKVQSSTATQFIFTIFFPPFDR